MSERIRVVIADDHPVFRDGLRGILAGVPGVEIVAEVGTGEEAVESAVHHRPDVVVMDLHMPDVSGVEATRRVLSHHPEIGILMLTMFEDDASVFAAMRAGARGYLLKGAEKAEIVRAIQAIARGEAIFGPSVARRIIYYFSASPSAGLPVPFPELTARERELLDLVAQGLNNQAIARKLFLSPKTVRNHVSNIFTKLQVAGRAEAIVRARQAGLGQRPGAGHTNPPV